MKTMVTSLPMLTLADTACRVVLSSNFWYGIVSWSKTATPRCARQLVCFFFLITRFCSLIAHFLECRGQLVSSQILGPLVLPSCLQFFVCSIV